MAEASFLITISMAFQRISPTRRLYLFHCATFSASSRTKPTNQNFCNVCIFLSFDRNPINRNHLSHRCSYSMTLVNSLHESYTHHFSCFGPACFGCWYAINFRRWTGKGYDLTLCTVWTNHVMSAWSNLERIQPQTLLRSRWHVVRSPTQTADRKNIYRYIYMYVCMY